MHPRNNSSSICWLAPLLLVLLSGCEMFGVTIPAGSTSQPTPIVIPTTAVPLASATPVSQATSAPTSLPSPTEVPSTPVSQATSVTTPPATQAASGDASTGTWQVAGTGDLNGDGVPEQIIYQPSDLVVADGLKTPIYAEYTLVAREVRIVPQAADLQAQPLMTISLKGLTAERELGSFGGTPERSPAGLLVRVDLAGSLPIEVIPLQADGDAYAQGVGIYWNQAEQAYRLAMAGGGPTPSPD